MSVIQTLEAKGYTVSARNVGLEWMCSLEWCNTFKTFFGTTETVAISKAVEYVENLEKQFEEQQRRLLCEGCGE
jgi:hypothetical protein